MIDVGKRKAVAERHGDLVVIRMTGGTDCLWLNMYLDLQKRQMTCDSDIGFYAYHWGRFNEGAEGFLKFCTRWMANEEWVLRKCIDERHGEKEFDAKKSRESILREIADEDAWFELDTILDDAEGYSDSKEAWAAVLQDRADRSDVELPDEWWSNIAEDYTPWQKRFAEICKSVIVPELKRIMDKEGKSDEKIRADG